MRLIQRHTLPRNAQENGLLNTFTSWSIDGGQPPTQAQAPRSAPVQVVAALYGVWLFALTVVSHGEVSVVVQEIVLLMGVGPAFAQNLMLKSDTRGAAAGLWFMVAFVLVFLASLLANDTSWVDLANVINVIFIFVIGYVVASCADTSLIWRIAGVYAVLTAPYLLYINVYGQYEWGRLKAGTQPNLWGLIALNVAIGAFCLRNRVLAGFCWGLALLTLYNAQARGSMVAMVPVVAVAGYAWWRYSRRMDLSWKMLAVIAALFAGMLFLAFDPSFLVNNVMRLNDPYRGLQSGFTGRDLAWDEALRVWYGSPVLGVGFRRHEHFMVFTELNAHNAYLAMLADAGVLGFAVYAVMLATSFAAALRIKGDHQVRLLIIAVILCYVLVGMFERRAINAGNSLSLIFIFACLLALRLSRLSDMMAKAQPAVQAGVQASVPVQAAPVPATAMAAAGQSGAAVVAFPHIVGPIPDYAATLSTVRPRADPPAVDRAAVPGLKPPAAPNAHEVRAMIESFLDVDAVARASLGRSVRAISVRQWREYRRLLRDLIAYSYATHFSGYSADSLQVGGVEAQADGTAFVQTWVKRPADGQSIAVDWRIGGGDDDGFKVLDVIVDDISVVRTLRADFAVIVASGGIPKLLVVLRRQVDDLKTPPRAAPPWRIDDRDPDHTPAERQSA